jgi:hypothetical protein
MVVLKRNIKTKKPVEPTKEEVEKEKKAKQDLLNEEEIKDKQYKIANNMLDGLKGEEKGLKDSINEKRDDIIKWDKLSRVLKENQMDDQVIELEVIKNRDIENLEENERKLASKKDEIQKQELLVKDIQVDLDEVNKKIQDKQNGNGPDDKIKKIQDDIDQSVDYLSKSNFIEAEKTIIDGKVNLIEAVNSIPDWKSKGAYFLSIWGGVPVLLGILGVAISFVLVWFFGKGLMMGIIPLWAPLVAVMGASVQILVGVVKDYKDDGKITQYRSLWYTSVIPVSIAFGIIAFLLISAGLISLSSGAFVINPVNQTAINILTNQTTITSNMSVVNVVTNQTTTTVSNATNLAVLALPLILCFLAGYATDWFMGLLANVTKTSDSSCNKK